MVPPTGQKRKASGTAQPASTNLRKRQKFQDARALSTQSADAALSSNGELNIASFIKAREYEINALDKGMKKARQGLSTRAFQQVPRHLRRRTASHNVKKVPRRLQRRAKREMIEDNTPTVNAKTRTPTSRLRLRMETAKALQKLTQKRKTVRQKKREAKTNSKTTDPADHVDAVRIPKIKKNQLTKPPLATSKFKRRQINKTWLPTHLWHAKRAHMTKSTEPLWRMAIPLRPTEKSYRATHRASGSRGCIAWDMSYMSTVCCLGTEKALEGLLKALDFHGNGWVGQKYVKWKAGTRFASGWVCKSDDKEALCIVDVFWCASEELKQDSGVRQPLQVENDVTMTDMVRVPQKPKTKLTRKIMIRLHPSAFGEFWLVLLHAAKTQKPQVLVEDLRFEVGSIEITGPGSTETLTGALNLSQSDGNQEVRKIWKAILPLTNPALLPANILCGCELEDPRLHPSPSKTTTRSEANLDPELQELMVDWPLDKSPQPAALFSHKARYRASKLPSQWTLHRRRQAILTGETLSKSSKDPQIPVILFAHRPSIQTTAQQGSWTLLAPWACIDVIWRRLLFYPLSTGRKPRFGGLNEKRQVAFENRVPWFPGDFPGTDAGKAWERYQSEQRFDKWIRRPPSRRTAWDSLDLGPNRKGELGRGWTCDWEYLLMDSAITGKHGESTSTIATDLAVKEISRSKPLQLTQRQRKAARASAMVQQDVENKSRNSSSPELDGTAVVEMEREPRYTQAIPSTAKALLRESSGSTVPENPVLVTIKITLLTRGTPVDAARIYRLPDGKARPTTQSSSTNPQPTSAAEQPDHGRSQDRADLRQQWLDLDPRRTVHASPDKIKRERINHRGLPRKAQHHPAESLRHINVLPKNPPQEIIDQYGPKPPTEAERKLDAQKELAIHLEEQKLWDIHIPCPGSEDLLGFVTTGGYNLAEGRGTAIGSIWLQRLLQGWTSDEPRPLAGDPRTPVLAKTKQRMKQLRDRQRHLCVVRNAGESIGRLAVWELFD